MKRLFKSVYYNLHWILSIFFLIYVAIPLAAPSLFHTGNSRIGWWIHSVYHYGCHQRAERSIFLHGEKLTYSIEELRDEGYTGTVIGYPFIGNEEIGYKVALCVRDLFLYSSMGITGLLVCFNVIRFKLKWWMIVGGLAPMALDGGIQFVSEFFFYTQDRWGLDLAKPFYLSNNINRAITGALFGMTFAILLIGEIKSILSREKEMK